MRGLFTYFCACCSILQHFALSLIKHTDQRVISSFSRALTDLHPVLTNLPQEQISHVQRGISSLICAHHPHNVPLSYGICGLKWLWSVCQHEQHSVLLGSRCKVCSSGACRLELEMYFCLWVSTRVFLFPDTFCIMKSMRVKLLSCDSHIH